MVLCATGSDEEDRLRAMLHNSNEWPQFFPHKSRITFSSSIFLIGFHGMAFLYEKQLARTAIKGRHLWLSLAAISVHH